MITHAFGYGVEGEVPDDDYEIPFGQADVKREGSDVTIVACSLMVAAALEAAEALAGDGIEAEVIDLRTLVPLDERDDPRLGRQDRPAGDRRRGPAALRRGVGDRRHRRASTASTRSRRRLRGWRAWTRRCPATRSRRPTWRPSAEKIVDAAKQVVGEVPARG